MPLLKDIWWALALSGYVPNAWNIQAPLFGVNKYILLRHLTLKLWNFNSSRTRSEQYRTYKLAVFTQHIYQYFINSLRPSENLWWYELGSTFARVMACCLMASRYCLNQCWLIINGFYGTHPRTICTGRYQSVKCVWGLPFQKLVPDLCGHWVNEFVHLTAINDMTITVAHFTNMI